MIDPEVWGTTYQWNYHNGGVAWAMQQLGELTGTHKYTKWATDFCDYQMEGYAICGLSSQSFAGI